ncbi:MAG: hypothetical protein GY847_36145, partial [Proteobacteria bacterium]|nr:hypothetical protein [Pseudomonadota bacterium]
KYPAATFFVRVKGDGMNDHGIFDNDTLIVDRSLSPTGSSIVVVLIDGELTVRDFPSSCNEGATVLGGVYVANEGKLVYVC